MLLNIDLNVQPVAPAALDTRCHTVCCRHDSRSTGGRLQGRCEAACVSVGLFFAQRCAAPSCRKRQRLNMSSGECMSYARQPGQSSSSRSTPVRSVWVSLQMTMCVACTCGLTPTMMSLGNPVKNCRLRVDRPQRNVWLDAFESYKTSMDVPKAVALPPRAGVDDELLFDGNTRNMGLQSIQQEQWIMSS